METINPERLKQAVKEVLVKLAADDLLPSDMTELDIDKVFLKAERVVKKEDLETLLKQHDWFYMYSEDGRVFKKGKDSYLKIIQYIDEPFFLQTFNQHAPDKFKLVNYEN